MLEYLKLVTRNSKTTYSLDQHIMSAMNWLSLAQKTGKDDGVSIRYSLFRGWESSYPETTGYIIPTFLNYHKLTENSSFAEKAIKMADWEVSIQRKDGAFIGGAYETPVGKLVFDTGQILFGLLSIYEHTKSEKYINAAIRAGDWLVKIQDKAGCWTNFSYMSIPHAYHARVAWPILKLYNVVDNDKYLKSTKKFVTWLLSRQQENGWFRQAGFTPENCKTPYTHTIAYTTRGLLEIGILLDEQKYINAAKLTADRLLDILNENGFYWGMYDSKWRRKGNFSCLTGNAQISIIFFKLFEITQNREYLTAALKINLYLKSLQLMSFNNVNISGAIAGSYPIWGEYERFAFPNWAVKFYADALILEKKWT